MKFYFFAFAARGMGLSGSDRIFIELSRRWSVKFPVEIFLWQEGFKMCQRQGLGKSKVKINVASLNKWQKNSFAISYFLLIIKSIWLALKLKLENNPMVFVYSASDFWMDSLPGFILKLRFPKITWIGSWYLTAPNPFKGFKEGSSEVKLPKLISFFYWLSQRPVFYLIRKWADFVFVTSQPDMDKFPQQLSNKKVVVVKGGVDLCRVTAWQKTHPNLPKIYEAVFQGRFHPQKGVVELIDIWNLVMAKNPKAVLIMIGDGPLMQQVKTKIARLDLEENIKLTGYLYDGDGKYRVFAQSKVMVHPAIYDSGGMAAAEGMAFGLPAVSFNLEALKTYYPKGMLKVQIGDQREFAKQVLELFDNPKLYNKTAKDAKDLIEKYWNWDNRAEEILELIKNNL